MPIYHYTRTINYEIHTHSTPVRPGLLRPSRLGFRTRAGQTLRDQSETLTPRRPSDLDGLAVKSHLPFPFKQLGFCVRELCRSVYEDVTFQAPVLLLAEMT
jgi:hypothetical protein